MAAKDIGRMSASRRSSGLIAYASAMATTASDTSSPSRPTMLEFLNRSVTIFLISSSPSLQWYITRQRPRRDGCHARGCRAL